MTRQPSRMEVTGRTRRARVARSLGPEVVAGLASVVAVALFATIATRQPAPSVALPTDAPPTSIATSNPASTATATASVPPTISPSLGPTSAPWAAQATALLGAEQRLASIRDRLVSAMAEVPFSANAIARELRSMNTTLTGALDAIASMGSSGAPSALVDDLRTAHEATLAVSLETLQASVQNVPAYQAGGSEVIALLDGISALARQVRVEAGLPSAAP